MNDPHVETLYFKAGPARRGLSYRNPPPIDWVTPRARYRLEHGRLTARPIEHYSTIEAARAALQSDLDAWEATAELTKGMVGVLRFQYADASVIDRNPQPSSANTILQVHSSSHALISEEIQLLITSHLYPDPPRHFNADSEIVRSLMARFREWKEGRQTLEHVAFYIYRLLRQGGLSDSQAANRWRISRNILVNLSALSSRKGDPLTARKPDAQPFAQGEREWLIAVIPAIILQVAAVEATEPPPELNMENLPTIKKQMR